MKPPRATVKRYVAHCGVILMYYLAFAVVI
jgi:hypothetical protein